MAFLVGGANSLTAAYDIDNSLRFNSADSADLRITPSSAGTEETFTISAWIKKSMEGANNGDDTYLFSSQVDSNNRTVMGVWGVSGGIYFENKVSGTSSYVAETAKRRDPSAWMHCVWAIDTTQGTAANRVKLYVNGTQITTLDNAAGGSADYIAEDALTQWSRAQVNYVGSRAGGNYYDGYMAEVHYIDGSQLTPSSFGETDEDSGIWKPKQYTGSYGDEGFFLEFQNNRLNELETATLDVTISGSASLTTDTPANLIDEDLTATGIGVNNGGGVVTFDADFGSGITKTLVSYGFRAGNSGAISQVIIKGSNDDSTYTTIDTDSSLATTSSGTRWNFQNVTNSTAYRYYRWEITTTTADHPYIVQFEAYSSQPTIFGEQDKAGGLGLDTSGNSNHFSSHGIYGYSDQTTDTPTNNFATLNPLSAKTTTFSEGNVHATNDSATGSAAGTIAPSNGKWYFEVQLSGACNFSAGVVDVDKWATRADGNIYDYDDSGAVAVLIENTDNFIVDYTEDTAGGSRLQNSVNLNTAKYGFAVDLDSQGFYASANGNWYTGTAFDDTDFSNATNLANDIPAGTPMAFFVRNADGVVARCNFGNPAGTISSGNADANGYGNFEYAVPSGYYAQCTKNLAEYG